MGEIFSESRGTGGPHELPFSEESTVVGKLKASKDA